MGTALAQRLLNGRSKHAAGALDACKRGEWAEFVNRMAPPKPFLLGRRGYGRCLAHAERSLAGPVTVKLMLVPLWACSTEDGASTEWVAMHGVAEEGQPLSELEVGPFIGMKDASPRADALWECTVRRWTAATVVMSRFYAPDAPLVLRAGDFGVREAWLEEVVSVTVREAEPLPRPTREVPMFTNGFEPRVRVSPELESQIQAMCFTAGVVDG
ncbi:hypothetical protein [Corallococcus exiguus]|uniref:Uncharacterized protein n=1 Tax=Corallococcus exiguus TaxID=83462 RepID=A0A7X4YET0_9BACT|nr:hypothetical protein [Corallococcus exiguus]NBC43916.1 hypothetical protein [Corallococcus exiguus]TNV67348.1 hypothetical protein FH620_01810 [Corallococcus exiguus]